MQHVKNAIGWNAMKMLKMHQNLHKNALECVWDEHVYRDPYTSSRNFSSSLIHIKHILQ